MQNMTFNDLADRLRHGREIEFGYQGRWYSITNHSGFWHLCDDTDHVLLETICPFNEKEILITKLSGTIIDGMEIKHIFDKQLYDEDKLFVI